MTVVATTPFLWITRALAPATARAVQVLGHVCAEIIRFRMERQTIRTLQRLDDRTLKDIGLDRSEISSVVQQQSRDRKQLYQASTVPRWS